MRKLAEQFRAKHSHPPGGYVVFYRGEVLGWWDGLPPSNHFKMGCIAVPEYRNTPCLIADEDRDGVPRWERMDPKYEPVEN